jgi:hypothetical protein
MSDKRALANLAAKVKPQDPDREYNLLKMGEDYTAQNNKTTILKANTDQLEGSAKFDMNKEYQNYLKDYKAEKSDTSVWDGIPKWAQSSNKALSLDEFKNNLRAQDKGLKNSLGNAFDVGGSSLNSAKAKYEKAIGTVSEQQNALGQRYHSFVPLSADTKFAKIHNAVNEVALNGQLKVINLTDPKGETSVPEALGLDPSNKDDLAKIRNIQVYINQEPSPTGGPSLSITGNGKRIAVSPTGLDPTIQDEIMSRVRTASKNVASPVYGKSLYDDIHYTAGARNIKQSTTEVANATVSSVHQPLTDDFSYRVIPGVNGQKRYRVYLINHRTKEEKVAGTYESDSDMIRAMDPNP